MKNKHNDENNNQQNQQNQQMQQMQQMQQIQKMLLMYNAMKSNQIFDPSKLDNTSKRSLINQNISACRVSFYKNFPKTESIKISYVRCDPGKTDSICEVKVMYEHSLDVASKFVDIGKDNFTKNNKYNPVVINIVGNEFTGDNFESCEEIRDVMLNIRTSFCVNPIKKNTYPLNDRECVYTPLVNVIRSKNPQQLLPWNSVYRVGFITVSPIYQNKAIKYFSSNDFIKTCTIIENIFQIAIGQDHKVLILSPFGHTEDNNPICDIITIYNLCIMKYGHKLEKIIIAIPPYYPKEIFEEYNEKIIKPNELVKEIDEKYEELNKSKYIHEKLLNKLNK